VSDLCILASTDSSNKFDCSSIVCSSTVRTNENYKDWATLSNEIESLDDYKKLEVQPHTRIALISGLIMTAFSAALLKITFHVIGMIFRTFLGWIKVINYALF
jgi:hypothetical protein